MENQVLQKRYVDKKKLGDLMKKLFPQGGFQVEVRMRVVLKIPFSTESE